jgi:hypothetical protein
MNNQKLIEKAWTNFEKNVISSAAPAVQRKEMRRAFYAGVFSLLQEMKRLGDEDVSEEIGINALEGIEAECREFTRRVGIDY